MNNDPLESVWNSAANQPPGDTGERLATRLLASIRRDRRRQAWWLTWTVLSMSAATMLAARSAIRSAHWGDAAALWPLLLLLGVPWIATIVFLRRFLRTRRSDHACHLALRTVLATAQTHLLAERRRLKGIALVIAVMTPVGGLAVRQLYASGKATADQAWSMALVFAIGLLLGVAALWIRDRFRLQPEERKIEALLRDLDAPAAS